MKTLLSNYTVEISKSVDGLEISANYSDGFYLKMKYIKPIEGNTHLANTTGVRRANEIEAWEFENVEIEERKDPINDLAAIAWAVFVALARKHNKPIPR